MSDAYETGIWPDYEPTQPPENLHARIAELEAKLSDKVSFEYGFQCGALEQQVTELEAGNGHLKHVIWMLRNEHGSLNTSLTQAEVTIEHLRKLAQDVCWYDFTDDDDDVFMAVERLRDELTRLAGPRGTSPLPASPPPPPPD